MLRNAGSTLLLWDRISGMCPESRPRGFMMRLHPYADYAYRMMGYR